MANSPPVATGDRVSRPGSGSFLLTITNVITVITPCVTALMSYKVYVSVEGNITTRLNLCLSIDRFLKRIIRYLTTYQVE
jgi:hypothetical protein